MALVVFSAELQRLTEEAEVRLEAADYRQLVHSLVRRYPRLEEDRLFDMAVAIDGEIIQDPLLEPVGDESEVHFLFRIEGG